MRQFRQTMLVAVGEVPDAMAKSKYASERLDLITEKNNSLTNATFKNYLHSPDINRPHKYKMVNDDKTEIATYPVDVLIFSLVVIENNVEII